MLALAFFSWWYGKGWQNASKKTLEHIQNVGQMFSIGLLFRTLFQPWRRIITYPGAGINQHFHALIDNSLSRLVGLFVRLFVLFAALLTTVILGLIGLIELLIWPLLPPAVIATLVLGFIR